MSVHSKASGDVNQDFARLPAYCGGALTESKTFPYLKEVFLNASEPITTFLKAPQALNFVFFAHGAKARVAETFESSAMDMITHVVRDESIVIGYRDVEEILQVPVERRRQLKEQTANIDAFESFVRASLVGDLISRHPVEPKLLPSDSVRDVYWTRVRGHLQTWFSLGLEDIAKAIGVAKATIVYINKPGRQPRPSTARKVMDLHALGSAVVDVIGIDKAREWLSTVGVSALRGGGLEALDRAVSAHLYARRRSEEATDFAAHATMEPDSGPFDSPKKLEAEAF